MARGRHNCSYHTNTGSNDIEQEIWLWDFAGQADYRLIHQLYMDETALAVLVFNPQSENPFEGLGQWDRDSGTCRSPAFPETACRCPVRSRRSDGEPG